MKTDETQISPPEEKSAVGTRVKVLLPMPFDTAFDYLWMDADHAPQPGAIVRVPLGKQNRLGIVWDEDSPAAKRGKPVASSRLKPVEELVDSLPISAPMRRLVDWVAGYAMAPVGAVLRMAFPPHLATAQAPNRLHYSPTGAEPDRMTKARQKVLNAAADRKPRTASELARRAGVSEGVVRGLADCGALMAREISLDRPYFSPDANRPGPSLSTEQAEAAEALRKAVRKQAFSSILLEGVTGSGKTEVYFEAIAEALRREGAQILVLLPEIALTSQWLSRFEDRFGARPVEWHSDLGQGERRRAWQHIAKGTARVVVGARSALFLPFRSLDLIVVDEEHDPSFKQEDGVLYNARDMAVVRASIEKRPIILSSATPSLETLVNAQRGRYAHVMLESRHGSAQLPDISAIDMRSDGPESGDWIAPTLADRVTETIAASQQVLLFLNRRGYAPLTLCRRCGTRLECPNCTAWLVEHRYTRDVQCHHCGFQMPTPKNCPECEAEDALVPCGPGVERLAEEVSRRWPDARMSVMTSDTISSPAKAGELIARIETGAVDILIGTQIITKGYHFPRLTLVGVIDADLGLRGGDLRAGERTWQQMMQVAGRAGRADHAGHVFLQTYDPDHPVTDALIRGDRHSFLERETAQREASGMPPFGRLAGLILSGPNGEAVIRAAKELAACAPLAGDVDVFGPAPAPLSRLRGEHRHRLLVRSTRTINIQSYIADWIRRIKLPASVKLRIDIDPYSFM